MINPLVWLQEWHANQSIENVGKHIAVNIKSLEKAAWEVKIDLQHTKSKGMTQEKVRSSKSAYNWYEYEITNNTYLGRGDFNKLNFLIEKFQELAGDRKKGSLITDRFFDLEFQEFLLENENDCNIYSKF